MGNDFCAELCEPGALQAMRSDALNIISWELRRVYQKPIVVLINKYDSLMHSAIDHGYAALANDFFAIVFSSLLKNNDAVYASMMVGICRIAKSSWLSSLNHLKIFPMHAEDDRYAKLFLFTGKEVEILCESYGRLSIELLRPCYDGYAATCDPGLVKLYNPFSVVSALEVNKISNFWVETGQYSPLLENLWRTGAGFHDNLDLLLTQKSVKLVVDEHVNFLSYDTISDSGLWGLLYYTGYLTIESVGDRSMSEYTFRIPNGEVTSEWHGWVMKYLVANRFTTFLQEYLALYCTLPHKEKVYQALCYRLIFVLFGKEYDVRMEQDAGHGQSDITSHPFSSQHSLALIFEIKSAARHLMRNGKRRLKTANHIEKDLEIANSTACRPSLPHESSTACNKAVHTLERNVTEDWEQVAADSTVVSECMVDGIDMGEEDVGDEDGDEDEEA
ncbi:hypothetical protein PILCRDRAFT_91525 [Piloderma croceum F 1598]|uniref:Uncharacterized protein n=1 Tax=Piloderma croceum (strain F 1598) TaxID=765440 RepID=A0A0C3ARR4_PILCF|nr:hypothetical protein PILCRDRAFT_91525 [Piloderma croceum F 1598]